MVHIRYLVVAVLSFATFGVAAAALQHSATSAKSTQSGVSLLEAAPDHEHQTVSGALLIGRTDGEEYPPWIHALKKRPFDEFGAPSWASGGSETKRQKVVPHPAPLRTIVPSNHFPPLHPDEPKPLPGMWNGEIEYKNPTPSRPKVYRGEPYKKKISKKATWPEPWSAAFGRRWRPGKKQFPLKHVQPYKGFRAKLHQVQNGGVKKPKFQRTKNLHFSKIRHTRPSKPRGPRTASGVDIEELSARGGAWSAIQVPFKKRPRPDSSNSPSSPIGSVSADSSLSPTASSSSASYTTAPTSPLKKQKEVAIPYASVRTIPPTANRPPLHPGTPPLLAQMRWEKQWLEQQAQRQNLHRFVEGKITTGTSTLFGPGKGETNSASPVRSYKKSRGLFGGRKKGHNSRLENKSVLRLSKRGSSAVGDRGAASSDEHPMSAKPRGLRTTMVAALEELSPRGSSLSSMQIPLNKRPRFKGSPSTPSPAHSSVSTASAFSSSASYNTALLTPLKEEEKAVTPYAPLRTIPPTANRPPLHPNTPLLLAQVRWQEQLRGYQQQTYKGRHFGAKSITTDTFYPSELGKTSAASGKQHSPATSSKKSKSLFRGRQKSQNSRLQRKNVLRLWKRSFSTVESQRVAQSSTLDHAEGANTSAMQQELWPRLFSPDPPSPKDKPSSSMFSPSPTPSPPRSSSTAEAERLAAQLATLRHTSPPQPSLQRAAAMPRPRLQRAAAMPQRWDASTEALLASLGKETRPASSTSRAGPQTAIPGVRGDRIAPPSVKERVRQAWTARFRREKRNKKLQAGLLTEKKKKRGPRIGEKLFPAAHPKGYKDYRNIFHSVQGGRISKFKNGW